MKKKVLVITILIIITVLSIPVIIFAGIVNEQEISKQLTEEQIESNIDTIVVGDLVVKAKEIKTDEELLAEKYEKAPKTPDVASKSKSNKTQEYNYFEEKNLNTIEKQIINIAKKFGKSEEFNEDLEKINDELNKIAFTGEKERNLSAPYKDIVNIMIEIYNKEQLSDDEKEAIQQFMQVMRYNNKDTTLNEKMDKIINEQ